jgi:hypothetical protein
LTSVTATTFTGNVSATTVAGTLSTAAQPTITSVGTLTGLALSGAITGGQAATLGAVTGTSFNSITGLSAVNGAANGTAAVGVATTVARADHVHPTDTTLLSKAGGTMTGSITVPTGQVVTITDAPTAGTSAANKNYVDAVAAGLAWKNAVDAATTANITLSGLQTIDGVSVTAGMRVLVKNQTTTSQNGIYVAASGAWTRSTDMDQTTPLNEFNGASCLVNAGTTQDNTAWVETATVTTVGTDAVTFTQFSGSSVVSAGTGLTLTGNALSVNASQTQITAIGTLTAGSIPGSLVTGTVPTATTATTAGTVTGATQANITAVGSTLTIGATNITSTTVSTTAVTAGQVLATVAATYGSVEFLISASASGKRQLTKILAVTDNTTGCQFVEYGSIDLGTGGSPVGAYTCTSAGGAITLSVTPVLATSSTFKVTAIATTV